MVSSTRKKARGRKFPERGRMGMKMAYNGSVCLSVCQSCNSVWNEIP